MSSDSHPPKAKPRLYEKIKERVWKPAPRAHVPIDRIRGHSSPDRSVERSASKSFSHTSESSDSRNDRHPAEPAHQKPIPRHYDYPAHVHRNHHNRGRSRQSLPNDMLRSEIPSRALSVPAARWEGRSSEPHLDAHFDYTETGPDGPQRWMTPEMADAYLWQWLFERRNLQRTAVMPGPWIKNPHNFRQSKAQHSFAHNESSNIPPTPLHEEVPDLRPLRKGFAVARDDPVRQGVISDKTKPVHSYQPHNKPVGVFPTGYQPGITNPTHIYATMSVHTSSSSSFEHKAGAEDFLSFKLNPELAKSRPAEKLEVTARKARPAERSSYVETRPQHAATGQALPKPNANRLSRQQSGEGMGKARYRDIILSTPLFNNKYIVDKDGKPLGGPQWAAWEKAKIRTLGDVIDQSARPNWPRLLVLMESSQNATAQVQLLMGAIPPALLQALIRESD